MLLLIRRFYYFLFLLTPLLFNPSTSEIFEFNKMIFIYFITLLIVSVWLIYLIKTKRAIYYHWLFIPFVIFFVSQLISTIFSIDLHTSFYGYYGRFNGGLLSIIAYLTLFFIFAQVADINTVRRLTLVGIVSSLVVILWALAAKYGFDPTCRLFIGEWTNTCWTEQFRPAERAFSTIGQPNWLAAFLLIIFFIGLSWFSIFVRQRTFGVMGVLIYPLLCFISILFTRSRSAFLALIILLPFYFVFLILCRLISKKLLFWLLSLMFLCGLILFSIKTGDNSIDRYLTFPVMRIGNINSPSTSNNSKTATTSQVTDSFTIRKIVWEGAIELARRYPWFGTGVETFAYAYYFTRPAAHNLVSEWDFIYNKAHNEYLNYLATTGTVGLLTYLLLIFSVVIIIAKTIVTQEALLSYESKSLICGLFFSFLAILITNFFGFSTTTVNIYFYLLPAMILVACQINLKELKLPAIFFVFQKQIAIFVITIAVILFWGLGRYYLADLAYARGIRLLSADDYQGAMNAFSEAITWKREHLYEDKLSGVLASLALIYSYQKESKTVENLVKLANVYNNRALQSSPLNVFYWRTKAKNFYLFYQISHNSDDFSQSQKALEIARSLAPTDPKIPYTQALFYHSYLNDETNPKDRAKIREIIRRYLQIALQLKPDFKEAIKLSKIYL